MGQMTDSTERSLKRDLGRRLLVGFLAVICLALFLHFKEVRVEMLELHVTANRFVVAQVDFAFPDEETTIILKQSALQGIGSIYRIDEKEIINVMFKFDNFLTNTEEWKKSETTYEDIYHAADALETLLINLRFTDNKTLQKMREHKLLTDHYLVFVPTNENRPVLPAIYWKNLKDFSLQKALKEKFPNTINSATIDLVVDYFNNRDWNLTHDVIAQNNFKQIIEKDIPQAFSRVKAGSRLIGQGDVVNSNHLAMLKAMKEAIDDNRNLFDPLTILGDFLIAFMLILLTVLFWRTEQALFLHSLQKISLLVSIFILILAYGKLIEYLLLQNTDTILDQVRFPLVVPFGALLISILLGQRIAIYVAVLLSIIMAMTLAVDHNQFLIINLVTSIAAIVLTKTLKRRKDVFLIVTQCWLFALPIIFAISFINDRLWSSSLLVDIIYSLGFMFITAILVVGILPILESLFNVMTDITLMEYMDPNNEILRRMTLEIPGTYQHSLALGNMAEIAAGSINANGLFCKVATLYHDIGKLSNPQYFIENQQGDTSTHQILTPEESAEVIISHVGSGAALAKKYHLPQPFIDIILEHHGTTLVYYFYRKELDLKKDPKLVDEKKFRYPGPKPHSKESVIIMIADIVEAASRTLKEITQEALTELVDKLVRDRADDGQFDESCITFEEVSAVKKTLIKALISTHHVRIKYPEKNAAGLG